MISLQPDEVDYVIYHYPCSDGFGSAYSAWKFLHEKFPDREVTYYGARITELPPNDLKDRNVLICDYSYSKKNIIRFIEESQEIINLRSS